MNNIFIVTTLRIETVYNDPKDKAKRGIDGKYHYHEKRTSDDQTEMERTTSDVTVGWFKEEANAREVIEENHGDIHECSFNYAVIEKCRNGLYGVIDMTEDDETWFHWEDGKYVECDKPEHLIGTIGFWM